MGCHALLQGIFLTEGLNSHLPASPALQVDSLHTEPLGKPNATIYMHHIHIYIYVCICMCIYIYMYVMASPVQ